MSQGIGGAGTLKPNGVTTSQLRLDLAGLLMVGFPTPNADSDVLDLVRRGVGGLMLSARNVISVDQLGTLIETLRLHAPRSLVIAVDQEPGRVARLAPILGETSSARQLALSGDAAILEWSTETGRQLAQLDIDVNLAPVLDIVDGDSKGIIGDRSFGWDVARVSSAGVAVVRGHRAMGVHTIGKHFPGHGGTLTDSHHSLPVLETQPERLTKWDLEPFRQGIAAGLSGVMVGHLLFRQLDPCLPASASPRIIHRWLRTELGFEGVAMTDALEMGAVSKLWDLPCAAELALRAGIDLVLIGRSYGQIPRILDRLEDALGANRLLRARVEQAHARIERLHHRADVSPIASSVLARFDGGA